MQAEKIDTEASYAFLMSQDHGATFVQHAWLSHGSALAHIDRVIDINPDATIETTPDGSWRMTACERGERAGLVWLWRKEGNS